MSDPLKQTPECELDRDNAAVAKRERLRQEAKHLSRRSEDKVAKLQAEIERLRTEIEQLTAERANRYWEGRWRDEKAENERLRAENEELVRDAIEESVGDANQNNKVRAEIERLLATLDAERERWLVQAVVFSQGSIRGQGVPSAWHCKLCNSYGFGKNSTSVGHKAGCVAAIREGDPEDWKERGAAAAVVAAERERCAKVCEALAAACVFSQEDDERLAFRRAAAVIRKGE